jgi:hypothetical protein
MQGHAEQPQGILIRTYAAPKRLKSRLRAMGQSSACADGLPSAAESSALGKEARF